METTIKPPRTMLEVYNCLPEGTPVQLINNQLIMSPVPKDRHQKLIGKLFVLIADFIDKNNLGETRVAPSDVFLNEENIYQPDIYFVSTEKLAGFLEDGFHGVPDLVIEILSPGSEKTDKTDKFTNYEAVGVKEYWIVDPLDRSAIGYKNVSGNFKMIADKKGQFYSPLLNTEFIFG